jgi:hypothetical protein
VWSSVVLKTFPTEVHCWQHVWCQNLISVSRGAKVAGNVHQLRFSGVGYDTPHHHTSSAGIVDLKDAVPCEPLIPVSVDTCEAVNIEGRQKVKSTEKTLHIQCRYLYIQRI